MRTWVIALTVGGLVFATVMTARDTPSEPIQLVSLGRMESDGTAERAGTGTAPRTGSNRNRLSLDPGPPLNLSVAQREWIEANPVLKVAVDPTWAPVCFKDRTGKIVGVDPAMLRLVAARLRMRIDFVEASDGDVLAKVSAGAAQFAAGTVPTPARERDFSFTRLHLRMPVVAITREDAPPIFSFSALTNQTVASAAGFAMTERLRVQFPAMRLTTPNLEEDCLMAVSSRQADVAMAGLAPAVYLMRTRGLTQLKLNGVAPFEMAYGYPVRRDLPILRELLDLALDSISEEERQAVFAQWVDVQVDDSSWARLARWALIGLTALGAALLGVGLWNRRLAGEVERRRRIETELIHARVEAEQANRAKSEFLAHMGHELRTPLNSILGFSSVLKSGAAGAVNPEQGRQLELIHRSGKHLLGIINKLLDLSEMETGRETALLAPMSVSQLLMDIERTLKPLAAAKDLSYATRVSPADLTIITDRAKVTRVVVNVVSNAIKFTERGAIDISARLNGAWMELVISDTGIGMRPEQLAQLFRPYTTSETPGRKILQGSGLGLYVCRGLIEAVGGTISAASEWGGGSQFTIRLPWPGSMPGTAAPA
jgi:signal transduction histidine kinase